MGNELDYRGILEQVNREAIHLINEDVGEHIGYYLERLDFKRFEKGSAKLKFSGERVQIIYDKTAEVVPFKIILDKNDVVAVSEAEKTLENILTKVLEDI